MDPNIFFPAKYKEAEPAKLICASCPVRRDCLAFALRTHTYDGVWGGFFGQSIKRQGRQFLDGTDKRNTRGRAPFLRLASDRGEVPFGHDRDQRS